jgi:predicted transcriptional regulator
MASPRRTPTSASRPPESKPLRRTKGRSLTTVFAKIDPDLRRRFTEIAQQEARTEKEIIETLIRHLVGLGKAERTTLLRGEEPPLQGVARAIELIHWGDHAFVKKRWNWYSLVYLKLVDEASQSDEIRRLALYELGHAFTRIGMNLRNEVYDQWTQWKKESLDSKRPIWVEYFDAIITAFRSALDYNLKFLELGHLGGLRFNSACVRSLIALSEVERELPLRSEWLGMLAEWTRLTVHGDLSPMDRGRWQGWEERWDQFGDPVAGWRQEVGDKRERIERVVSTLALGTIADMDEMIKDNATVGENNIRTQVVPSDPGELIHLAKEDTELQFLRHDAVARDLLRRWFESHESRTSWLARFQELRKRTGALAEESTPEGSLGGATGADSTSPTQSSRRGRVSGRIPKQ